MSLIVKTSSPLDKIDVTKPYKTHGLMIPLLSFVLVVSALSLAFMIVYFRLKEKPDFGADILFAALAFLLALCGVAVGALANGLRTKLVLEAARIVQENNPEEVLTLRYKLLDMVRERLKTIEISPNACTLPPATPRQTLNSVLKDVSGVQFTVGEDCFQLDWTTTDPKVATVNAEGTVTRVAPGTCIIKAAFRGIESTDCTVTCPQ